MVVHSEPTYSQCMYKINPLVASVHYISLLRCARLHQHLSPSLPQRSICLAKPRYKSSAFHVCFCCTNWFDCSWVIVLKRNIWNEGVYFRCTMGLEDPNHIICSRKMSENAYTLHTQVWLCGCTDLSFAPLPCVSLKALLNQSNK